MMVIMLAFITAILLLVLSIYLSIYHVRNGISLACFLLILYAFTISIGEWLNGSSLLTG